MLFSALVLFLAQISFVAGCGCNINRTKSKKGGAKDFLNLVKENANNYCPIRRKNGADELKRHKGEDRVLIPSGEYQFGTDDVIIETDKEGPKRMVKQKSFYLDRYEVSNRDFAEFARSTSYKTDAEVFGDSFVFSLFLNSTFKEQLKDFRVVQALWWYKVDGVNWRHPYGPDSDLNGLWDHPVVHVSWRDAVEYCAWRNSRLPTEAEWEAACRGGHRDTKYPWGDKLFPDRQHMANIWQGTFPDHNSAKDGYVGTNPVKMFPPNDFGLYNMAGNVWEWTSDTWDTDKSCFRQDVVQAVVDTGLDPNAIVCDQGSTFQACINSLRADTRRHNILNNEPVLPDNQVIINGKVFNVVFDPPHLIKGIRNNFLTKDMLFCGKIAKWQDIIDAYQTDCQVGEIRMVRKLTDATNT